MQKSRSGADLCEDAHRRRRDRMLDKDALTKAAFALDPAARDRGAARRAGRARGLVGGRSRPPRRVRSGAHRTAAAHGEFGGHRRPLAGGDGSRRHPARRHRPGARLRHGVGPQETAAARPARVRAVRGAAVAACRGQRARRGVARRPEPGDRSTGSVHRGAAPRRRQDRPGPLPRRRAPAQPGRGARGGRRLESRGRNRGARRQPRRARRR